MEYSNRLPSDISRTISASRTILCMQVVFMHMVITAPVPQDFDSRFVIYQFVIKHLSFLNWIAVPLFAAIAGYLFFMNYSNTWSCYIKKIKNRAHRLLMPVLISTTFFLLLFFIAQEFPYTRSLFSGQNKLIADYNWLDFINAYTGIFTGYPFVGQCWFLIDLFIICLFSPFIYIYLKVTGVWGFLVISIIWYVFSVFDIIGFSGSQFAYFFILGAFASIKNTDLVLFVRNSRVSSFILFPFFYIASFVVLHHFKIYYNYIYFLYILVGIIFMFNLCHWLIIKGYGNKLVKLSAGSFFVFIIHQQILMLLKRAAYKIIAPDSNAMLLLLYVAVPSLVIFLCYVFYNFLRSRWPRFLYIFVGD